jgi:AraC-like DNA-binding protein
MSQGTPAAPALPLEILLARLAQFCIPRDLYQIFHKDTTFQQFQFRCQQIDYVRDIAEREQNIPIFINALARVFDCSRSSVQSAFAHGLEPPGEPGKHPVLEADREQQILDWIQQKAKQSTRVGKTEIKITARLN